MCCRCRCCYYPACSLFYCMTNMIRIREANTNNNNKRKQKKNSKQLLGMGERERERARDIERLKQHNHETITTIQTAHIGLSFTSNNRKRYTLMWYDLEYENLWVKMIEMRHVAMRIRFEVCKRACVCVWNVLQFQLAACDCLSICWFLRKLPYQNRTSHIKSGCRMLNYGNETLPVYVTE